MRSNKINLVMKPIIFLAFAPFAALDKIFYLQIKLRVKFNCHDKSTTSILQNCTAKYHQIFVFEIALKR